MLAGLQDESAPGQSMFPNLRLTPSAEDMEKAAEEARFNKTVKFDSFHVKTFDLGDEAQVESYMKVMSELFVGVQAKTHVILSSDRQFVKEDKPRWVAHVEWAMFELKVEAVEPVKGESDNGKVSSGQHSG